MDEQKEIVESDFFDFEQAFSNINQSINSLSEKIETLIQELAKKKKKEQYPYPYPYPYPQPKKKKMSEDGEEETQETQEEDPEKKEMAEKLKQYEEKERQEALEEFASICGNEKIKEELADFSTEQIKKLISLAKEKKINFGKTLKSPENTKDFEKIEKLKQKIRDFEEAGLTIMAQEAREELKKLESYVR